MMVKTWLVIISIFVFNFSLLAQNKAPFINQDGSVLIEAGIKEQKGLFLFDTGAQLTVVSEKYFDSTCNIVGWMRISDYMGKSKRYSIIMIPNFYIGDLHFKNVKAILKKDLTNEFKRFACTKAPVDGIIGANILKQHNWELNFIDTTYYVSSTPIQYENGLTLDVKLKKGVPYISTMLINGREIENVLFDTGDVNNIILSSDIFNQLFTDNVYTNKILAGSFNDSTKRTLSTKYYEGLTTIFSEQYPLNVGTFIGRKRHNIGSGFLKDAIIAINYSNQSIKVDKNRNSVTLFPKSNGVRISYENNIIKIFSMITEVEEKYPELTLGSTIKTIDGKPANYFATMTNCEQLTFFNTIKYKDVEIETDNATVYKLPAIY